MKKTRSRFQPVPALPGESMLGGPKLNFISDYDIAPQGGWGIPICSLSDSWFPPSSYELSSYKQTQCQSHIGHLSHDSQVDLSWTWARKQWGSSLVPRKTIVTQILLACQASAGGKFAPGGAYSGIRGTEGDYIQKWSLTLAPLNSTEWSSDFGTFWQSCRTVWSQCVPYGILWVPGSVCAFCNAHVSMNWYKVCA